ncbi:peptidylprolyl isomerase [Candidatus Fonsibacter ubiquis]|uniref:peptidylprolyl isomerase n=1 Tax=Candidatus Fonsibacter ubiquis TaxID=1925548 RepID=UPI000C07AD3B|nr:peptidylprolyl isomerase [Candidatus Fonsibacter ubiquis]
MFKKLIFVLTLFLFSFSSNIQSKERSTMIMKLKFGEVKIELFDDVAPNHAKRIKTLADSGKYDGVAFHRVIDGFMAQTGDVKFGNTKLDFNAQMVGTGGSEFPDLKAEFNNIPHQRGVLSMARSQSPDSANSQFFICFDSHPHLDRNYTAFGRVVSGMEFVDKIKKGAPGSGVVENPDIIISLRSAK